MTGDRDTSTTQKKSPATSTHREENGRPGDFFARRARQAAIARWEATPPKARRKAARAAAQARWRAERERRESTPLFVDFPITAKGKLTEAEKDRIFELADEDRLSAWTIARRIGRHPSTISWYLTRLGFKRLSRSRKAPFLRKGQRVVPFSEDEDRYMLRRSAQGVITAEITREMNRLFPHSDHPRSRDTVSCRLMMLASDEAAREMA